MDTFWSKVVKCEHKNLYEDYWAPIYCDTPYCGGFEVHCKDCKVFISKCDCGYSNYLSGWPVKRYLKKYREVFNHDEIY